MSSNSGYALRIGRHICKISRLYKEREKFKDVDREGKELHKAKATREKTTWLYDDNKTYSGDVFKLIGGKARSRVKRTTDVQNQTEVDVSEVKDALIEEVYLCDSPSLYDELSVKDKALKFLFTSGGYSISQAYVVAENGELYMYLTWGSKTLETKNIRDVTTSQKQRQKANSDYESRATETDLFDVYKE